jgi:hypothetical protein
MNRILQTLGAVALVLAMSGGAQAVPLSSLFGGGTITAGDKLFDQWVLVDYLASDPARSFDAANIEVTALNDGGLEPGPGLSFSVSNGELSVGGDGIFAFVDLMFGFRASVLDPGLRIKDNSLLITQAVIVSLQDGANDNGMFILESIGTALGQDDLGTKEVEFSVLDGVLTSALSDSATFPPQAEIWVTKNILVWATDTSDQANLFAFEQRFSQTVPEPGTSLLLIAVALGAVGARCFRRRT